MKYKTLNDSNGLIITVWSGYEMYYLSCEVRNMLCTCLSYIGRFGRQATQFGLLINWHGLKDLDRNLIAVQPPYTLNWWNFLKNLTIYMKVQESPSFINIAFLSLSIGYFQESSHMCHLIKRWRRSSWPIKWFVVNVCSQFLLIFNEGFSASAITTLTVGSSLLSSNANIGRRSWSTACSNLEELIH